LPPTSSAENRTESITSVRYLFARGVTTSAELRREDEYFIGAADKMTLTSESQSPGTGVQHARLIVSRQNTRNPFAIAK